MEPAPGGGLARDRDVRLVRLEAPEDLLAVPDVDGHLDRGLALLEGVQERGQQVLARSGHGGHPVRNECDGRAGHGVLAFLRGPNHTSGRMQQQSRR